MLLKAVYFVLALAVTVNSFDSIRTSHERNGVEIDSKKLTRQSPWSEDWYDWKKQAKLNVADGGKHAQDRYESWGSQGKRQTLDRFSLSQEDSDELSKKYEFKKVQKVYYDTIPEQAGNGRVLSKNSGAGTNSRFRDSDEDLNNRINKDNHDYMSIV